MYEDLNLQNHSRILIDGFESVQTVLTLFEPTIKPGAVCPDLSFFPFELFQPVRVKPIREKYFLNSHGIKRLGSDSDLTDSGSRILAQIHGFMNENTVECTKIHRVANPSKHTKAS